MHSLTVTYLLDIVGNICLVKRYLPVFLGKEKEFLLKQSSTILTVRGYGAII